MKNTINFSIIDYHYEGVPVEVAKAIQTMLAPYEVKGNTKAETPKGTPKAKAETAKTYAKAYAVLKDGKSVTVGGEGFIPTKVFKGITYSLKQAGAKYDSKTKAWTFDTKTACKAWTKAQDARA